MKAYIPQLLTPMAILIGLIAHGIITKVNLIEIKDDWRPKSISISGLRAGESYADIKSFRSIDSKELIFGSGALREYSKGSLKISDNGVKISLSKADESGCSACIIPTTSGYLLVEYNSSNYGS